jgi:hypothetical protein
MSETSGRNESRSAMHPKGTLSDLIWFKNVFAFLWGPTIRNAVSVADRSGSRSGK